MEVWDKLWGKNDSPIGEALAYELDAPEQRQTRERVKRLLLKFRRCVMITKVG
jgi:hypothetical protein